MKRITLFLAILASTAIMISMQAAYVSAALCSNPNQTIISLYQANNSHAAVFNSTFNDPAATYSVCYNQIFGTSYSGGSNPWACNGVNNVLNLYYQSNSHAAQPGTSEYKINVCYGDLLCSVKTECNAAIGEKQIATLSYIFNAHISINDLYGYKICCQPSIGVGIYNAQWEDANGNPIVNASLLDGVQMVTSTLNITGKTVNLSVYNAADSSLLNSFTAIVNAIGTGGLGQAVHAGILNSITAGMLNIGDKTYFIATYTYPNGSKKQIQSPNLTIISNTFATGCQNGGLVVYDSNGIPHNTSEPSVGNWCLGIDGIPDFLRNGGSTPNDCCPLGTLCSNSTSSNGFFSCNQCTTTYYSETDQQVHNIITCNDYNRLLNIDNETRAMLCRGDCAVARQSPNQLAIFRTDSNYVEGSGYCEWDNVNQLCGGNANYSGPIPDNDYSCFQTYVEDQQDACVNANSYKIIRWIFNLSYFDYDLPPNGQLVLLPSNGQCPADGETTVPCRNSIVALPFFGATGFILAIALIAIAYVIIFKTKLFGRKNCNRRKS